METNKFGDPNYRDMVREEYEECMSLGNKLIIDSYTVCCNRFEALLNIDNFSIYDREKVRNLGNVLKLDNSLEIETGDFIKLSGLIYMIDKIEGDNVILWRYDFDEKTEKKQLFNISELYGCDYLQISHVDLTNKEIETGKQIEDINFQKYKTIKTNDYSEMLQNCKISKKTANFISCKMALSDLFNQMCEAIKEMYGEEQTTHIIEGNYFKKSCKLGKVIDKFITDSIYENICCNNFDEI